MLNMYPLSVPKYWADRREKGIRPNSITGAPSCVRQVYHNLKSVIKKKYGQVCGRLDPVRRGRSFRRVTEWPWNIWEISPIPPRKAWEPTDLFCCSSILCCQLVKISSEDICRYVWNYSSWFSMIWVHGIDDDDALYHSALPGCLQRGRRGWLHPWRDFNNCHERMTVGDTTGSLELLIKQNWFTMIYPSYCSREHGFRQQEYIQRHVETQSVGRWGFAPSVQDNNEAKPQ